MTTLLEFRNQVEKNDQGKVDVIRPLSNYMAKMEDGALLLMERDTKIVRETSRTAAQQVFSKLGYYKRVANNLLRTEDPNAEKLINQSLEMLIKTSDDKRMIRMKDDKVRAVVSNNYRVYDNLQVVDDVINSVEDPDAWDVKKAYSSGNMVAFRVVTKDLKPIENVDDVVGRAFEVSNGETGMHAYRSELMLHIVRCTNGLIVPGKAASVEFAHFGSRELQPLVAGLLSKIDRVGDDLLKLYMQGANTFPDFPRDLVLKACKDYSLGKERSEQILKYYGNYMSLRNIQSPSLRDVSDVFTEIAHTWFTPEKPEYRQFEKIGYQLLSSN
jgi:hypothetical protein